MCVHRFVVRVVSIIYASVVMIMITCFLYYVMLWAIIIISTNLRGYSPFQTSECANLSSDSNLACD